MNETTKHTPGEWIFDPGDKGDDSVGLGPTPPSISVQIEDRDLILCELHDPCYREDRDPENEYDECLTWTGSLQGNGQLMAAAPDLLAACLAILGARGTQDIAAYNLTAQAVAKAFGGP